MNKTITTTHGDVKPIFMPIHTSSLSEYYIAYRLAGYTDERAMEIVKELSRTTLYADNSDDSFKSRTTV